MRPLPRRSRALVRSGPFAQTGRRHLRRSEEIPMDINRFTEKAQEALAGAQRLAVRLGNQQVDVEHVLLAMLDQEQGLAPAILTKSDLSVDALKVRVQRELERLPKVSVTTG